MAAAAVEASFTSPTADAQFSPLPNAPGAGLISQLYKGANGWSLLLTFLLVCIVYDQCKRNLSIPVRISADHSTSVTYIWYKAGIVGPTWKAPFIGPFLEAVYPDMNKYKAKWASGDLSCVSVFHK